MIKLTAAFAALAVVAVAPFSHATAQDVETMDLPTACKSEAGEMAFSMNSSAMGHSVDVDEAHATMIVAMGAMNQKMTIGMMAPDIDVAFVCGMIPHHQGAISMAHAELKYGKDEWTRQMARKVIDAQTKEIADLVKWLEENAQ